MAGGRGIDDRQPSVTQSDAARRLDKRSLVVRPAMTESPRHRRDLRFEFVALLRRPEAAGNPAHPERCY